ncbi:MAG: rod shape-determining protein [Parcubacteria group bacterium RIFCSPLOWO2_01_FULL_48_18]|nr:MAG: rod shape-determining protein [Parcubacteria group bacterium RIFCSPHIGHO2_02_FULL_48_10b]OHB21664.1 MAG: rod shape-determining protein [Parcubacteria group bacterium RIFCSPLOWO2_01_FULL_48_18]
MLNRLLSSFSTDVGIDLGTANSLVYLKGNGIIINESSTVAINNKTGQVLAVGESAKRIVGRTPMHISAIRPIVNGVIADFDITQEMLRYFLNKTKEFARKRMVFYPRVVIGVPSNLTEVERKAVEDAALQAGAARAYLVDEPIAAALGARFPIEDPTAHFIVDIGGGTTEIAVISMSGIVASRSLKIAGDRFNEEIIKFFRDELRLLIGEPTAEEIKIAVGSAYPLDQKLEVRVRGRDLSTGLPKEVVAADAQIRSAIAHPLSIITDSIKEIIEKTPPELVGDIMYRGIYLCGGGSLLKNIDRLIEEESRVKTSIIDDPMTAVVRGTGVISEDLDKFRDLLFVSRKKQLLL